MAIKETFGVVISNKMHKTAVVIEKKPVPHKKYKKILLKTNKYYVHDPENQCEVGDQVKIEETRPLSKNKRWKITKLIKL
uniref:Small ribosomal subunit protein uS17c n=1 Tax=Chondria sp. (in: red algae) TaxID=1982705 RepID=A0A1Z1ME49_9FLOR|nr:ribosomal protein S17 [Chondria sp. (in: red algae)]